MLSDIGEEISASVNKLSTILLIPATTGQISDALFISLTRHFSPLKYINAQTAKAMHIPKNIKMLPFSPPKCIC